MCPLLSMYMFSDTINGYWKDKTSEKFTSDMCGSQTMALIYGTVAETTSFIAGYKTLRVTEYHLKQVDYYNL